MAIWDRLFGFLFRSQAPALSAPQGKPSPTVRVQPSAASVEAPSPAFTPAKAAERFDLAHLRQRDGARLTPADIDAAARGLGVAPAVFRALIAVESAGNGFSADGRALIVFEPVIFSKLTSGRYDSSHPHVSQAVAQRGGVKGTQAERWSQLTEAYALDADAALKATAWGLFQVWGQYYIDAGYSTLEAFALDVSTSEALQLQAFVKVLQNRRLVDELQKRDWDSFAQLYESAAGARAFANALRKAYARLAPKADAFLEGLRAQDPTRLAPQHFAAAARRLGCEPAAVQAVVEVESGDSGFAPDGRPVILFEPHIFSRLTQRRFDATHPAVSYGAWGAKPYPQSQADRWAQLAEAYALDPEAAVAAASWGLFQILGLNHLRCGYDSAKQMVADIARSEERQLAAFEAFVRNSELVDELQRGDWEGFARIYNGPGQVERYGRILREAYEALKAKPLA